VRNEVEFREKLDNYLKSKNGESELTFEYIKNLVEENKLQVIPKRDNVLGTTLSMGLIFAEKVFLNSYWLFVLATGGACYFTSDHPVSIGKPSGNALKGRKNLEFEIAIPISPSCFLLLHQYEFIDVVEGVDYLRANEVYEINKLMLRVADRYVFCSSEEIGMWVLETKQRLFSQM